MLRTGLKLVTAAGVAGYGAGTVVTYQANSGLEQKLFWDREYQLEEKTNYSLAMATTCATLGFKDTFSDRIKCLRTSGGEQLTETEEVLMGSTQSDFLGPVHSFASVTHLYQNLASYTSPIQTRLLDLYFSGEVTEVDTTLSRQWFREGSDVVGYVPVLATDTHNLRDSYIQVFPTLVDAYNAGVDQFQVDCSDSTGKVEDGDQLVMGCYSGSTGCTSWGDNQFKLAKVTVDDYVPSEKSVFVKDVKTLHLVDDKTVFGAVHELQDELD